MIPVWAVIVLAVVVVLLLGHHPRRTPVPSHSPEYVAALRSRHWRVDINRAVRARAHNRCEAAWCRQRRRLTKHHLTYERLGHELPDDVVLLCPKHHRRADRKRRAWESRHRRVA